MTMKWLKQAPNIKRGISFGKPWAKGELQLQDFSKSSIVGNTSLQTKILAYWPDKSIKWTAHTGIFQPDSSLKDFSFKEENKEKLARDKFNGIYVDTGVMEVFFPRHGEGKNVLDWLKISGEIKVKDIFLATEMNQEKTRSKITQLEIEENGPITCCIKVCGSLFLKEKVQDFILRFKFFKDLTSFDLQVTTIILSDENISELYLSGKTILSGDDFNRFISLAGQDGIYTEPAKYLLSRRHGENNNPKYAQQIKGMPLTFTKEDEALLLSANGNALWNNFSYLQATHRSYEIKKQTSDNYVPINIGYGTQGKGSIYLGGNEGGLSLGIEKFWEKAPREFVVKGLSEKETLFKIALWSKNGGEMNFSHYSQKDHMFSAYEGMEEIRSTPIGISNSDHLHFKWWEKPATQKELFDFALEIDNPAKIVFEPCDYQKTKVFGTYALPDYTNETKAFLEEQMLYLRNFYLKEQVQRDWFGFWNYGDVMHTYDPTRHMWRYDLGGFAWQNTELVPNIWLWQDFLRTGDSEVFEFAKAMTEHTSEVDQYHAGEYQGLGSRHNVLHWGCQCKEARISMAGLHRYFYYLSGGDERTGEIMTQVKDNEAQIFDELPPLREFYPAKISDKQPIRVGPDWSSLTSNWFTQWERSSDQNYLQKILTGIENIKETPDRLLSGPTYLFNKEEKSLSYYGTGNIGAYHMIISFGAPQVWLEISENINDETWKEMIAEFGRFYSYDNDTMIEKSSGKLSKKHFSWPMFATGLMGYAAQFYKDHSLAKKAWDILLTPEKSGIPLPVKDSQKEAVTFKKVTELPWVSTNCVSQWCLNVVLCLTYIGGDIPTDNNQKMEEEK